MDKLELFDFAMMTREGLEEFHKKSGLDGIGAQNLDIDVYHAGPGIGSSLLNEALRSPAHFFAKKNPIKIEEDEEPSPALLFGSAAHCAVLEPDKFKERFIVRPPSMERRSKAGKEEYDAWLKNHPGATVLKKEMRDDVLSVADAVMSHPTAGKLFYEARLKEFSVWSENVSGPLVRIRVDAYNPEAAMIIDLKTTEDARPEAFAKSLAGGYHLQAALYLDVLSQVTMRPHRFYIIAVERRHPHGLHVYEVGGRTIMRGRRDYNIALRKLVEATENPEGWHGYDPSIIFLDAPGWFLNDKETTEVEW